MTTGEKIGHLHRRFGLGLSLREREEGEKRGVDATLQSLIDYDSIPDANVSPHEFVWRDKEEADLGTWRYRTWWIYMMLTTRRPLQEKLALFWHDHFAAAESKVEDGPMMLSYLQTLRHGAAGSFGDLLASVSKEPALMRYLDMERSMRGEPNENFAREVMELFTLGIGNYTEKDVKEMARALTGWGYVNTFWEMPGNSDQKMKTSLKYGRPFASFITLPSMWDDGPKTILGKTAAMNGDDALAHLARQDATARYIAGKLWTFFAYEDPEPHVVDRVAKAFTRSKGKIRPVLYEIARMPEFWSPKCVRTMVKSPVDLCIPVARQTGVGEAIAAMRDPKATPETQIPQRVLDQCGYLSWTMERQGLALLNPPNVAGWDWGQAWISSASMTERMRFRGLMLWGEKGPDEAAKFTYEAVRNTHPSDAKGIVEAFGAIYDLPLADATRKTLEENVTARGGMECIKDINNWTGCLDRLFMLAIAAPEMHLC